MTNLAKCLITSVVFGSSFNCCTALGKSLSLRLPPVTLMKECPQYHMSFRTASVSNTKITVPRDIPILLLLCYGYQYQKLVLFCSCFLSVSRVRVERGRGGGGRSMGIINNVSTRRAIYLQTQFSSLSSNINCRAMELIVWFDLNKRKARWPKSI